MSGIPQRYKDMGFTKVGQKKKSTRPGKKWMVLAKKGDQYKVVHGGDSNMQDYSQHRSEKRQKAFWDRMGGRDSAKAKDPFSPLYWHKRLGKWESGGTVEGPSLLDLLGYDTPNFYYEEGDDIIKAQEGEKIDGKSSKSIKTFKNDPEYFNSRTFEKWQLKLLRTGNFGIDPKTEAIIKLEKPVKVPQEFLDVTGGNYEGSKTQGRWRAEASLNEAYKNPVMYAPGAIGLGATLLAAAPAAASGAMEALNAPLQVAGRVFPAITPANVLTATGIVAAPQNISKGVGNMSEGNYLEGATDLSMAALDLYAPEVLNASKPILKSLSNLSFSVDEPNLVQASFLPDVNKIFKGLKEAFSNKSDEVSPDLLDAYETAIRLKTQGYIKDLPETPKGFDKWLKSQYNKKPLYRVVDVNPNVTNDPIIRKNIIRAGLNPDNPNHVAEYMGTTVAPSNVINRGRRSGGHSELLQGSNKDILYFAEDPRWIGERYGGSNPYYVKVYADQLPKGYHNQVMRLRSNSQANKNYSRNYPGFNINNVPSGVLFEDGLLRVGNNLVTPIIGDRGAKIRDAVKVISGYDFNNLTDKFFNQGGYVNEPTLLNLLGYDTPNFYYEDGGQGITKAQKGLEASIEEINNNPLIQAAKIFDPTGVTSYPDVYFDGRDLYNNPSWKNAANLGINIVSALPIIGKATVPLKLAKGTSKTINLGSKVAGTLSKIESYPVDWVIRNFEGMGSVLPSSVRKGAIKLNDLKSYLGNATTKQIDKILGNSGISNEKITKEEKINLIIDAINSVNTYFDMQSVGSATNDYLKKSAQYGGIIKAQEGKKVVKSPGMLMSDLMKRHGGFNVPKSKWVHFSSGEEAIKALDELLFSGNSNYYKPNTRLSDALSKYSGKDYNDLGIENLTLGEIANNPELRKKVLQSLIKREVTSENYKENYAPYFENKFVPKDEKVNQIETPRDNLRVSYPIENMFQIGGFINNTGYTPGTDTYNNPFNIIPSGDITMENTPFDILAIPNNDKPKIMKSGKNYKFKNSDRVLEIPIYQDGGYAMGTEDGAYYDGGSYDNSSYGGTYDRPILDVLKKATSGNIINLANKTGRQTEKLDNKKAAMVTSTILSGIIDSAPFEDLMQSIKDSIGIRAFKKLNKKQMQNDYLDAQINNAMIAEKEMEYTNRQMVKDEQGRRMLIEGDSGNVLQTYQQGGQVPKYQRRGVVVPPTRQDSLNLYNNQLTVDKYYNSKDYNKNNSRENTFLNDWAGRLKAADFFAILDNEANDFVREYGTVRGYGFTGPNGAQMATRDIYRRDLDPNRFYQRESVNSILDTRSPMQMFDRRIFPTRTTEYENNKQGDPLYGDVVKLYHYDPALVVPEDMAERVLTPEQLKRRRAYQNKNKPKTRKKESIPPKLKGLTPQIEYDILPDIDMQMDNTPRNYRQEGESIKEWDNVPNLSIVYAKDDNGNLVPKYVQNMIGERIPWREQDREEGQVLNRGFQYPGAKMKNTNAPIISLRGENYGEWGDSKYQQGGAINFDNILNSFGKLGVNTEGVKVDDPKQSINNLMLAMAASQMFMKGDNNIDLSSPLYMQQGGLLQPGPYAPGMRPMNLIPEKKGFGNNFLNWLTGVNRYNKDVRMQNQNIESHNAGITQAGQDLVNQTNLTTDKANTDMFSQMPMLLGMFSALANMKKGGEVMYDDIQTDGSRIPIQAETRNGQPEMYVDPDTGEIAEVWARDSHDKYKEYEDKGLGQVVTDMPKPGGYVASADNDMKIDTSKINVYLKTPNGYKENPKLKSDKPKLPTMVTLADVLGLGKGAAARITPAKALELTSKKFKIDKDTINPYDENSSFFNEKYRAYLVDIIKQESEKVKAMQQDYYGNGEIIKAQYSTQLDWWANKSISPPNTEPQPVYGAAQQPVYYGAAQQPVDIPRALPNRPLPLLKSSKQPDYMSDIPKPEISRLEQRGANTTRDLSGIGTSLASGIGAIISLGSNKREMDRLKDLYRRNKNEQARLYDDRLRNITLANLFSQLGLMAQNTNVERQKFDDSYYRDIDAMARQKLRTEATRNATAPIISALRANPYAGQMSNSLAAAQAQRQMYNALNLNTENYLKDLDARAMGLQEIMNKRYADDTQATMAERASENQRIMELANIAGKQGMLKSDNDMARAKILADLERGYSDDLGNYGRTKAENIGTAIGAPFGVTEGVINAIAKIKGMKA